MVTRMPRRFGAWRVTPPPARFSAIRASAGHAPSRSIVTLPTPPSNRHSAQPLLPALAMYTCPAPEVTEAAWQAPGLGVVKEIVVRLAPGVSLRLESRS